MRKCKVCHKRKSADMFTSLEPICNSCFAKYLQYKSEKIKFVKHDQDKPRYSLIPNGVLSEVIAVLEIGAKKYSDDNWMKCPDRKRYGDALFRHFNAYKEGEMKDPESGHSHMAHAICCAMFLMWYELNINAKPDSEEV